MFKLQVKILVVRMAVRTVGSKRYVCLGSNGSGSLAVYEKAALLKKPNHLNIDYRATA